MNPQPRKPAHYGVNNVHIARAKSILRKEFGDVEVTASQARDLVDWYRPQH